MYSSKILFQEAQNYIPGGVNSPVRAFRGVGGTPIFFKRGEGAYLIDEDDKRYIDYLGSWGPLILGHAHPKVIAAVQEAITRGLSFGTPTALEIKLAKKISEIMPAVESVRLVNSGTEATMSAIRLARAVTGRDKIVKFAGCYHGHSDALLVNTGSGALTLGVPSSPGVPKDFVKHTLTAKFNDLNSVSQLFEYYSKEIAAIIVEPIAGNMNCVPPIPGFLKSLREICDHYGSLLIFDEVMTGFRVSLGGAQELFQIIPDLTTLGKVIGGGMPVGAFGGRRTIMEQIAPRGPVYQAGTLSGNPIAVTAGLITLEEISKPNFFESLAKNTQALTKGLLQRAQAAAVPFYTTQYGGMFGLFFTDQNTIENLDDVCQCNIAHFQKFFHEMLKQGVYLAPSAYEAGFVSAVHGPKEISATLAAAERAFAVIK